MRPFSPSPRDSLIELIEQGAIPPDKIPTALRLTQTHPDVKHWQHFLDQLLLWLGGLALAFALMFFVAYNWDDLGRFAKFGLVQVCMVASVIAYWRWHRHPVVGKLALLVTSLGLGVLLALYGQTYQTGADPWQLFFNWALLMLPWVLIARFPALWILWLALINLSCMLYHQIFGGLFGLLFYFDTAIFWILFLINTGALVCWELLAKKIPWLDEQWALRLLALGCGIPATWLALHAILDRHTTIFAGIAWLGFAAALFFYYRKIRFDLFMLAGGCLSGIVVMVTLIADKILRRIDDGSMFLLLALLVIGLSTAAAMWLRRVHKEQHA